MVMSLVRLGTRDHCAGEGQQQFSRQVLSQILFKGLRIKCSIPTHSKVIWEIMKVVIKYG
jgi:hypothetical protein